MLTVPHSVCKSEIRDCDRTAHEAAIYLHSFLPGSEILESDKLRKEMDLNRKESRDSPFRKSLNNKINNYKYLLDVHSFPNEYLEEAKGLNFFPKGAVPPDVVLMTGTFTNDLENDIANVLCNKYKVQIIEGVNVLDILSTAEQFKKPAVLLEFNEKYTGEPLKALCKIISGAVTRKFK